MKKKVLVIISIIIGLLLVGGGIFAYTNSPNDKALMKNDSIASTKQDKVAIQGEPTVKDVANSNQGSYVELVDYNKNPGKYADSKKVYFFHASWCSICRGIEKEINADMTKIPTGITIIKTDFDSSIDLRKKYGVTTQYTFVQVDNNGNETAQWSATSLNAAISGIRS